jgi:hypothetical protein
MEAIQTSAAEISIFVWGGQNLDLKTAILQELHMLNLMQIRSVCHHFLFFSFIQLCTVMILEVCVTYRQVLALMNWNY